MTKKLIKSFISVIIFCTVAVAGDLFSKLPYGIELGKVAPQKVLDMQMKHRYKGGYKLGDKFMLNFISKDSRIIEGLYFNITDQYDTYLLPKAWRKAGINICHSNDIGTSYEQMILLIKDNKGFDIEESIDEFNHKVIKFKIGQDKQYKARFNTSGKYLDICKGGLRTIGVKLQKEDEY